MNVNLTQGRNANVAFNGDFYEVITLSGYRVLFREQSGYMEILPPDCLDSELGEAISNALDKSRVIDPDSDDFFDRDKNSKLYKKRVEDLISRFSYKTKKALFKKMNVCGIKKINGSIAIEPMLHEKIETWSSDGISESDYVIIPDSSSSEEIGAAIRLAFSRCKSRV